MTTAERSYSYLVHGIQVELVNPPRAMGLTRRELEPTAMVWGDYAIGVSRGEAESITVSWDENGVIRPPVVRKVTV